MLDISHVRYYYSIISIEIIIKEFIIVKKNLCKNCNYYTAYYKKWGAYFGRMNNGFCAKHKKRQTQFEVCNEFRSNEQSEKRREEQLLNSLEQSLESVNQIAQILKEKYSD